MSRNARIAAVLCGVVLVLGGAFAAGFLLGGEDDTSSGEGELDRAVAPLTGLEVTGEAVARLDRPALAAKIDNSEAAVPQTGLEDADIVYEIRVEGVTRFLAVFHSAEVGDIGPIRSARTSDPALLAALNTPLFANSGGNPGVLTALQSADAFNVGDSITPDSYYRSPEREAPHNLYAKSADLWALAPVGSRPPNPQFSYLAGEEPAAGEAAAGATTSDADFEVAYVWDDRRGGWARYEYGLPQTDESGRQLAPTNVVVLDVQYSQSQADATSPEALTVGSGSAMVFVGGRVVSGTWARDDPAAPFELIAADGSTIRLQPGTTWISLVDPGSAAVLDEQTAQQLLGS